MTVKHTTHNRVGGTYGERRQAAELAKPGPQKAPDAQGFLGKLRDFFNVDPKYSQILQPANAKFQLLDGENVSPYQALTATGPRCPKLSDQDLLACTDAILKAAKPK